MWPAALLIAIMAWITPVYAQNHNCQDVQVRATKLQQKLERYTKEFNDDHHPVLREYPPDRFRKWVTEFKAIEREITACETTESAVNPIQPERP